MKKIFYLFPVLLAVLLFVQCTEKRPREIERPVHGLQNSTTIEIDKVLLTDSATVLYIDAYFAPNNWIRIDSATYIQADGNKYTVLSSDGIKLHEEFYMPESGEHHFTLTFPALPKGTKSFDFIESDCDNCFKVWDIDLTGKTVKYTPDIPAEVLQVKSETETLPQPKFGVGRTKVTMHLTGMKEGFVVSDVRLITTNFFTMEQEDIEAKKEADNTYVFEMDQYATAQSTVIIDNSYGGDYLVFITNPGEQAEVYFDVTAKSKYDSRYNPQKDLQYVAFKGDFGAISNQIATIDREAVKLDLIERDDFSFLDLTKEQFLDQLFDKYNNKLKEIDTSTLTPIQKQLFKTELKSGLVSIFSNMERMHEFAYKRKNNIDWREPLKDYTPPRISPEDYLRLKEINLNDPMWIYSSSFTYTGGQFAISTPLEELNKITGSESGLLQDLNKTQKIMQKATRMEALTPEEESILASTSNPHYKEVFDAIYKNTKQRYDEVLAAGGFTIEATPQAADDKIMDAIIAKYKGKAVFVDLWATWCGPCLNAMKTMKPIKPEISDKGVVIIYLTGPSSPKGKWMTMLADIGGTHYYLNQEQWAALGKKYQFGGIPTYMIFDKTGKKVFQHTGYPGNDKIKEELGKVW